jgi:ribosomal protein S18 acetylase RimI-like enzyme
MDEEMIGQVRSCKLLRTREAEGLAVVEQSEADGLAAMAQVERLLTASAIRVSTADPQDQAARAAMAAYFGELARRFERGFDPALSISADDSELRPPAGLLLLATLRTEPVGIGALKFHDDGSAEVKRMWVAPAVRGMSLGRRLLAELEARAAERGVVTLRLETNRALDEAIGLYRSAGYREVAAFNDEAYADHWFEKTIGGAGGA